VEYSLTDKINLIRVYLKNGKSIESISQITQLSIEEILEIIEKYLK
jgi:hypothetical protein